MNADLLTEFVDFARCVSMGSPADFTAHIKRFHSYIEGVDWGQVASDIAFFITKFRAQNVAELEMGDFANQIFALARKHRVRPITEMTLVLAGVVTSEGLAKILNPTANSWQEIAAFLMPLLAERQATAGS